MESAESCMFFWISSFLECFSFLIKLDLDRTRSISKSIYYDLSIKVYIDAKTMFFGVSAQNDAEWWSSCRNWIDVRYSSQGFKFVQGDGDIRM